MLAQCRSSLCKSLTTVSTCPEPGSPLPSGEMSVGHASGDAVPFVREAASGDTEGCRIRATGACCAAGGRRVSDTGVCPRRRPGHLDRAAPAILPGLGGLPLGAGPLDLSAVGRVLKWVSSQLEASHWLLSWLIPQCYKARTHQRMPSGWLAGCAGAIRRRGGRSRHGHYASFIWTNTGHGRRSVPFL